MIVNHLTGSVALCSTFDVSEIQEYAVTILEIDPDKESHLLYIAKKGLCTNLPKNWKPCQDLNGDLYYFNFATGESTWEHPCDEFYRNMAQTEREKAGGVIKK